MYTTDNEDIHGLYVVHKHSDG